MKRARRHVVVAHAVAGSVWGLNPSHLLRKEIRTYSPRLIFLCNTGLAASRARWTLQGLRGGFCAGAHPPPLLRQRRPGPTRRHRHRLAQPAVAVAAGPGPPGLCRRCATPPVAWWQAPALPACCGGCLDLVCTPCGRCWPAGKLAATCERPAAVPAPLRAPSLGLNGHQCCEKIQNTTKLQGYLSRPQPLQLRQHHPPPASVCPVMQCEAVWRCVDRTRCWCCAGGGRSSPPGRRRSESVPQPLHAADGAAAAAAAASAQAGAQSTAGELPAPRLSASPDPGGADDRGPSVPACTPQAVPTASPAASAGAGGRPSVSGRGEDHGPGGAPEAAGPAPGA